MKIKLLSVIAAFLLFTLLVALAGCGGGSSQNSSSATSGTGAIAVKVALDSGTGNVTKADVNDITTIRFIVSGPGMAAITQDFAASAGKGVIDGVPVGTGRLLTVQGLTVAGSIISSGEAKNITVIANQTSDVGTVTLSPVGIYSISGRVTLQNGSPLAGVTISTGSKSATSMTDGSYSISGLNNGSYTLTASLNGYHFDVASIGVNINNASVSNIDFGAYPNNYSISGKVASGNTGLAGVTISTGSYSATTLSDGSFTITNVPNGSYTLTPTLSGYGFSPANVQVTVNNANVTGQNFTATQVAATYSISGKVTSGSAGLSGVTVSVGNYSATSQADGTYTINNVPNGSYTLVPSLSGYTFSPASSAVTVNNANVTGQNFTATASGGGGATGSSAYFPTTVGNTWTYDSSDTSGYLGSQTMTVSKVNGSTFTLVGTVSSTSAGSTYTTNLTHNVSIINGAYYTTSGSSNTSTSGYTSIADITYTPGYMILPGQMSPGATAPWSTTGTQIMTTGTGTAISSSLSYTGSYTVVGTESVTVPAGTWTALKITQMDTMTITTLGNTSTNTTNYTYWYVNGVGWVKSTSSYTSNGTTYTSTTVLKSYNVK